MSLSSRRAWIEIFPCPYGSTPTHGRSPHGERGLKYYPLRRKASWHCRSPHGERGLKCLINPLRKSNSHSRSPHGERGLKCAVGVTERNQVASLSSRRAWIEIATIRRTASTRSSLSSRRAWIEMSTSRPAAPWCLSLSSRRAWIEIPALRLHVHQLPGSLSSRRAWIEMSNMRSLADIGVVALLTESVD